MLLGRRDVSTKKCISIFHIGVCSQYILEGFHTPFFPQTIKVIGPHYSSIVQKGRTVGVKDALSVCYMY